MSDLTTLDICKMITDSAITLKLSSIFNFKAEESERSESEARYRVRIKSSTLFAGGSHAFRKQTQPERGARREESSTETAFRG